MKKILLLSLVIGLIIGCQKEVSYSSAFNSYESLGQFFEKNQKPSQTFSANVANAISIQTSKGTKISFDAGSFVTLNDQPVTGNVSIEVKEIFTPSEMILNRALTVANGEPIESGGEFLVKVTKNGRELKLAPGYRMRMRIPSIGVSIDNMRVFNGQNSNSEAGSQVNWTLNNNPGNVVFADTGSLYRSLFADSVSWINCDRLLNEPRINYTIYPGNINGFDSISVVVHFSGRNSVLGMPWDNAALKFYSPSLIASNATVVGIGIKDHKLQASVVPVNLQNNQSATLNFLPVTEKQLKERLAQLH